MEKLADPEILKKSEEQELGVETTSSERERLVSLVSKLCGEVFMISRVIDWTELQECWNPEIYNADDLSNVLVARKNWLEAMESKEKVGFLIKGDIDNLIQVKSDEQGEHSLYNLFLLYCRLGYADAVDLSNSLLNKETIWNGRDGSLPHQILKFLYHNSNTESPQVIVSYIKNICTVGYTRSEFRNSDISYAVSVLAKLVGVDSAKEMLRGIDSVQGVLDEVLSIPDSYNQFIGTEFAKPTVEFDLRVERERTVMLEKNLQDIRNNPRPIIQESSIDPYWDEDSYLDDLRDYNEVRFNEENIEVDRNTIDRVRAFISPDRFEETVIGPVRLHFFNFFTKNPKATDLEVEEELARMTVITNREVESADIRNPLPTIGIEIEIPTETLTRDRVRTLSELDIPNYEESFSGLWEVNPNFSYSALAQARVIQELVNMGAIRIDQNSKDVVSRVPLSLHINFGISALVREDFSQHDISNKYRDEIRLVNDLFVSGFTSVERIRERKTRQSSSVRGGAAKTKKDNKQTTNYYDGSLVRLELRANEFKNRNTFRMLSESQRLVAMLISHIKFAEGTKMSFAEACLADIWTDFEFEVKDYFKSVNLPKNEVDTAPKKLIEKIETTDLRMWSRFLVSSYSRKINEVIKEAVNLS
jgi:hypothetical protein